MPGVVSPGIFFPTLKKAAEARWAKKECKAPPTKNQRMKELVRWTTIGSL